MPRRPENNFSDLHIRKVPGDLLDRFKAACDQHQPPVSMNWCVIALLEKFAKYQEGLTSAPVGPVAPKPKRAPRAPKPKAQPPDPPTPTELPDLGAAF